MQSQPEASRLAAFIAPGSRAAPGYGRRTPRDRVVDAGFVLIGLATGALGLSDPVESAKLHPPHWLLVVSWVVAALALVLRRRWPAGLAVVLILLSVLFPPAGGPSGLALFSAAVHRRSRVSLSLCAVAVASGIVQFWIYPVSDGPYSYWPPVAIAALACLVLAGWGIVVRTRRELMASLSERAIRAEAEQKLRVEQGQRAERERIAREMHDALGHRLSLLSVHAGALEFRPDMPADELSQMAGVIRGSAREAIEDLREIVGVLRSPEGPQRGITQLDELVAECRVAGMTIHLELGLDLTSIPASVGRHAYRITQEALTNARKHAPGQPVHLQLDGAPGNGLNISVTNKLGCGGTGPGSRVGLIGLAERASLTGGRFTHTVANGEFRLSAWLPWSKK